MKIIINKRSYLLFIFILFVLSVCSQEDEIAIQNALDSIQGFEIYTTVERLASEEFEGRHTGHEGYTRAAEWIGEKFKSWGLEPLFNDNQYLHSFPSPYSIIDEAEMTIYLYGNGNSQFTEKALSVETDFLPLLYSDSGDNTAEMVFIGWGIHAPELGYDDYFGVDVEGKFVMCFRGTPDPRDERYTEHDHHRTRMATAKEKGALGLIYIYDEPIANPNGDLIEGFTPVKISSKIADLILEEKGVSSETLRRDLLHYTRPLSFELNAKARIAVSARHFPDGVGYNVAGVLRGSNTDLKNEYIVVGAHLDHCGTHLGLLFGGAQDNASGSGVVVHIARAFTQLEKSLDRSIIFVLFGAEEMGLIGSKYFVEELLDANIDVTTMLNFDMVGTGDGAIAGYSVEPVNLLEIVNQADKKVGTLARAFPIRRVGVRGSDHARFFEKGIPVLYFMSNGPHIRYHTTGDNIYRINPTMLEDIARLGFLSTLKLTDGKKN